MSKFTAVIQLLSNFGNCLVRVWLRIKFSKLLCGSELVVWLIDWLCCKGLVAPFRRTMDFLTNNLLWCDFLSVESYIHRSCDCTPVLPVVRILWYTTLTKVGRFLSDSSSRRPSPSKMAPTTTIETVTITRPLKVSRIVTSHRLCSHLRDMKPFFTVIAKLWSHFEIDGCYGTGIVGILLYLWHWGYRNSCNTRIALEDTCRYINDIIAHILNWFPFQLNFVHKDMKGILKHVYKGILLRLGSTNCNGKSFRSPELSTADRFYFLLLWLLILNVTFHLAANFLLHVFILSELEFI